MVSLYKYPPFSALSSFLLVADPPAKAAMDEIGIRISNKKTKVKKELNIFSNLLKEFELKLILNGENDINDAIITIHPGAGGTESQDWAEMLYRMYSMWSESKGFKFNVIDFQTVTKQD